MDYNILCKVVERNNNNRVDVVLEKYGAPYRLNTSKPSRMQSITLSRSVSVCTSKSLWNTFL